MLTSASNNHLLAIGEHLFDESHITPAARANDTSDVFVIRGGKYLTPPAQPFRSATLDHIQCGHIDCEPSERIRGANLGLYSVTFNNRLDDDLKTLEEYRRFRIEAESKGFRHFLEVFDPNAPHGLNADQVPAFINDHIARTLAGVAQPGRPVFLKMVYHGPRAMEELVRFDPNLVVGILGGAAGTTYDAFKLLAEAQKYGARAALYGRKINAAECQLAFIEFLRLIVEHQITPEEAVRAYHGVLERLKIRPHRRLEDDLILQTGVMSYGGTTAVSVPAIPVTEPGEAAAGKTTSNEKHDCGCHGAATASSAAVKSTECHCQSKPQPQGKTTVAPPRSSPPNFAKMTTAERLVYHRARLDRLLGI